MPLIRATRRSFPAWLLAAVLLAAEVAALAHLYDHASAEPEGQCALCLHGASLDKPAPATPIALAAPGVASGSPLPPPAIRPAFAPLAVYPARGPPPASVAATC